MDGARGQEGRGETPSPQGGNNWTLPPYHYERESERSKRVRTMYENMSFSEKKIANFHCSSTKCACATSVFNTSRHLVLQLHTRTAVTPYQLHNILFCNTCTECTWKVLKVANYQTRLYSVPLRMCTMNVEYMRTSKIFIYFPHSSGMS